MGYTPAEFEKTLLGQFTTNTQFVVKKLGSNNWSISHEEGSFEAQIKTCVAAPRKIAMLTLPVLDTEFAFITTTESEQKDFLKTFFKYFHKGGG